MAAGRLCETQQVRNALKLAASLHADDPKIVRVDRCIDAASQWIANELDREFLVTSSTVRRFRALRSVGAAVEYRCSEIAQVGNVTSITTGRADENPANYETVASSSWWLSGQEYRGGLDWPAEHLLIDAGAAGDVIEVTASFGWAEIPADIVQAAILLSERLVRREDSPLGVAGLDASSDLGSVVVRALDPDLWAVMRPYRRGGVL